MKMDPKAALDGLKKNSNPVDFQVAAFCVRGTGARREVLLITSSENRWIFPKGWPMDGKTNAEAAAIEAWEEAGVKAETIGKKPMARLETTKAASNGTESPLHLDVYKIDVAKLSTDYPEANKRERRWVALPDAANAVDDPAISAFLSAL